MKSLILAVALFFSGGLQSATLDELNNLTGTAGWDTLVGKIRAALIIKAYALTELASPTAEQLTYALAVLQNPSAKAKVVVFYVIAANSGASTSAILTASDVAIQNNVNDAVDNLFAQ